MTCGAITPISITNSGTATLTCSSTIAGTYVVTITGTIDTLTHSTTATFIVNNNDFTLTATSPAAVTVGTSATSTITVNAVGGFSGTVTLTDTVPANPTSVAITPRCVT